MPVPVTPVNRSLEVKRRSADGARDADELRPDQRAAITRRGAGIDMRITRRPVYNLHERALRGVTHPRLRSTNRTARALPSTICQNQGSWQISDVYLDGTISQVAVQSEFNSILRPEGVGGLLIALNRKVDLLSRGVAKAS